MTDEGYHKKGLCGSTVSPSAAADPAEAINAPPFALTPDQFTGYLDRLAGEGGFSDIAFTSTSTSRVFLYSTIHLEPDYAAILAEWLDVGQSNNP